MIKGKESDVCLILEGSYPFVTGGVSSWIQMIVSQLSDLTFSILVISPDSSDKTPEYEYPPNVVEVVEVFIEDKVFLSCSASKKPSKNEWEFIEEFHEALTEEGRGSYDSVEKFINMVAPAKGRPAIDLKNMLLNRSAFSVIRKFNEKFSRLSPLLDYFHTWRSTHYPLFHLLRTNIPRAKIYHTISTGFAGFLGVLAHLRYKKPLLLTEHGIYTKEREMDIMRAEWIKEHQKGFWLRYFNALGRLTYHYCDEITSLFEINRQLQISMGALPDQATVIPNGVSLERYSFKERPRLTDDFAVGLVGRVTPIKDVKTFVKSCALVYAKFPKVRFYILGPWDEAPEYVEECKSLSRDLSIDRVLEFTGRVNMNEWYEKLDLVVLSSVKEAQPLVLIEAMCSGIPSVATRVGGVQDIISESGLIVNPKRPSDMAVAIEKFITDKPFYQKCVKTGLEKAKSTFSLEQMINNYRNLYERHF